MSSLGCHLYSRDLSYAHIPLVLLSVYGTGERWKQLCMRLVKLLPRGQQDDGGAFTAIFIRRGAVLLGKCCAQHPECTHSG